MVARDRRSWRIYCELTPNPLWKAWRQRGEPTAGPLIDGLSLRARFSRPMPGVVQPPSVGYIEFGDNKPLVFVTVGLSLYGVSGGHCQ